MTSNDNPGERMLVKIDRLEPAGSGRSRTGRPWTKFLVYGRKVDGSRIAGDAPVYTFEDLNGEEDVYCLPFRNGESFTLRRVKSETVAAGAPTRTTEPNGDYVSRSDFNKLAARVAALEDLYERLPLNATREK